MKNGLHPLLAAASLIVVVAGLRAAAPIVNLFLLAVPLTILVKRVLPVMTTGISWPAAPSHSR